MRLTKRQTDIWLQRNANAFAIQLTDFVNGRNTTAGKNAYVCLTDGPQALPHLYAELIRMCMQFYLPNAPDNYYIDENYAIEGFHDVTAVIKAFYTIVTPREGRSRLGEPPHAAVRKLKGKTTKADAGLGLRTQFTYVGVRGTLNQLLHSFLTWVITQYVKGPTRTISAAGFFLIIRPSASVHELWTMIETKEALALLTNDSDAPQIRAAIVLDQFFLLLNQPRVVKSVDAKKNPPPPLAIPPIEWDSVEQPSEDGSWLDEQIAAYQALTLSSNATQTAAYQPLTPIRHATQTAAYQPLTSDYTPPTVESWGADPYQSPTVHSNRRIIEGWRDAQLAVPPVSPVEDPSSDDDSREEPFTPVRTPDPCSPAVSDFMSTTHPGQLIALCEIWDKKELGDYPDHEFKDDYLEVSNS